MNQCLNQNSDNEHKKLPRRFDWGPASNSYKEGLKDVIMYLLVALLLLAGLWSLMNLSNAREASVQVTEPEETIVESGPVTVQQETFTSFSVQLGAFADRTSAVEAKQKLVSEGFAPFFYESKEGFEIYRISFGPFNTESEAKEVSTELNQLGFYSFVIESP